MRAPHTHTHTHKHKHTHTHTQTHARTHTRRHTFVGPYHSGFEPLLSWQRANTVGAQERWGAGTASDVTDTAVTKGGQASCRCLECAWASGGTEEINWLDLLWYNPFHHGVFFVFFIFSCRGGCKRKCGGGGGGGVKAGERVCACVFCLFLFSSNYDKLCELVS